jgi:hypothetical protein
MKTQILAVCLFGASLMQGCVAYAVPVGGYYNRESFWYYKDGRGMEHRENTRYHHPADQQHDDQKR